MKHRYRGRFLHLLAILPIIQPSGYCGAPLEWTFTTVSRTVWSKGEIAASPSVGQNGLVYFGAKDHTFYAVDSAKGKAAWKYRTHGAISSSAAIDDNSVVYFGSEDNFIYALDGVQGGLEWKFETGGKVRSSPALSNLGILYVGSDDKNLYALDTADGTKLWKFTTGGKVSSSVALAEGLSIFFGSEDGFIYSLDADTGEKKWAYKTSGKISASPAIGHNNSIIVGSEDNYLYCLNGRTGKLKWRAFLNGPVKSSAAIGPAGRIIVGGGGEQIYQLNPADGGIVRRYKARGAIDSSPAVGRDGIIYFGSNDRRIYAVDINGEKVWSHQTSGKVVSSPAIGPDGAVYIGSEDHKLYAFKDKPGEDALGPVVSSWPMFGKNSRRLPGLIEQENEAAPRIVFQPQSQTRPLGQRVALIAEVHGQGPFEYTWYKDDLPITGQIVETVEEAKVAAEANAGIILFNNKPVLFIPQASDQDSGDYYVDIQNPYGITRSFDTTLTIIKPQPAQIVLNPKPRKGEYGHTIQLKVTARGSGPVTFEWYKDGRTSTSNFTEQLLDPLDPDLNGVEVLVDSEWNSASEIVNDYSPEEGYYSTLTFKSIQTKDEGFYYALAYNDFGNEWSTKAKLSVKDTSSLFEFSNSSFEDDGYLRVDAVGPINHNVIVQESSDLIVWKDRMTIPLNKPLLPTDQKDGQPDLGKAELRLPVFPVGEVLEQKKVEIAVQLSKLAIAKRISDEQGIEVDPASLEVELIFILSRGDPKDQQLEQGYPIDPDAPAVLRRLDKGSFFRFRLVEALAPAP